MINTAHTLGDKPTLAIDSSVAIFFGDLEHDRLRAELNVALDPLFVLGVDQRLTLFERGEIYIRCATNIPTECG
jgi:hypothetical protein